MDWQRGTIMATSTAYLSTAELEARYETASDPIGKAFSKRFASSCATSTRWRSCCQSRRDG